MLAGASCTSYDVHRMMFCVLGTVRLLTVLWCFMKGGETEVIRFKSCSTIKLLAAFCSLLADWQQSCDFSLAMLCDPFIHLRMHLVWAALHRQCHRRIEAYPRVSQIWILLQKSFRDLGHAWNKRRTLQSPSTLGRYQCARPRSCWSPGQALMGSQVVKFKLCFRWQRQNQHKHQKGATANPVRK